MFGAIYTGLSGLQAYSEGLQKVSNNVANLNSLGFKSSSVSFSNIQGARDTGGLSYIGSESDSGGVGLAKNQHRGVTRDHVQILIPKHILVKTNNTVGDSIESRPG